jgi:PAS domain S-box-containing protein
MAPPLMTLFIDRENGFEWRQWPRTLDLVQVIILTVAIYLFTFGSPLAWEKGNSTLARFSWAPESLRDLVLFLTFAASAIWTQRRVERSLYGRLAIFFGFYLCGEIPYLYLQATRNLNSGTPWDLVWSLPFAVATVLAVTAGPAGKTETTQQESAERREPSRQWVLVHLASLIFPLLVLLMAAGIAEQRLVAAIVLVLVSFACSVGRLLISDHQQLQAAKALEESNALLKSVFEGTGEALYIKDLEGRYILVNRTFARMVNLAPQQIIGKTANELLTAEEARRVIDQDRKVIESGKNHMFESPATVHGQDRSLLVTKAPWHGPTGKIAGLIAVLRDITEHRQIEEHLRQSQKMEAIGTLAGGVAHDFNNLLMVINGYSSLLSDSLTAEGKLRGHVDQIQKAAERATSLTRQLLAFSRKQTIQPSALKLNQVITGMEKLLHRLIGENISISTQLAPDLGTVLADAGQMEQVILNLAVNARDAMPEGGQLTFETRNVEIGDAIAAANSMKPGRYVEFVVKDTGTGMDMSVQTRLFEPFFTTKPAGEGTGLGLSTVYGILKQSNGNITFTSQPGHGTTFRVYLPRTDSVQTAFAASLDPTAALDGREKVLLVEDDAAVCNLIRAVLGSHGYTVICPARPQDAEQIFEQHDGQFDLLLSDVVMPEISGAELSKRLCAKNPRMKVLFMSGYIGDAVVRQGIQEKEVAFLQKPFAPVALARKVREVLDGSRVSGG